MQITDILASAQGGQAAANLAKAFGIDPATAERAVGAVVPQLAARIERNTLSRGGIADLIDMLGKPGLADALDNPSALGNPETEALGVDVLDQVLWNKNNSRRLAEKAAADSGLSEDLIKKMLPTIAAMAMGGLAKGSSGALGDIIGQLTGSPLPLPGEKPMSPRTAQPSAPQPTAPAPRGPVSTGTGDVGRQVPLPIPGNDIRAPRRPTVGSGDNPYGDLRDVIRRGGRQLPGGLPGGAPGGQSIPGGGSLGNIVRSILGSLLGFQNKGVMSWIINFLLIKIGLPMLKRILSRVFTGR